MLHEYRPCIVTGPAMANLANVVLHRLPKEDQGCWLLVRKSGACWRYLCF